MLIRLTYMNEPSSSASEQYLRYREIHEFWESEYLAPGLTRFYEKAFDVIASELKARGVSSVLDAGCGYCLHTARLARHGFDITGVDFSPAALEAADEYLTRKGLRGQATLQRGDLLDLPFSDESVDAVVCWGVLMHIPDLKTALGELARVVRPGGCLVLMENNSASLHVRLVEPGLRLLKRALRRPIPQRRRTDQGVEEWNERESGGLLVRKTDIAWLTSFLETVGLQRAGRYSGQFTELYTSLGWEFAKSLLYRFNEMWLDSRQVPSLAMGNILIFDKPAPSSDQAARPT